jgi:polyisoprenoid-binding protein YceI
MDTDPEIVMSQSRYFLCTALMLAVGMTASAAVGIDPGKSQVTATFRQMGVPVEGSFQQVSGSITFDAEKPAEAKAEIAIVTSSFDIGDEDYNAEVRKPEWFDSKQHPQARFAAVGLKPLGAGRYQAIGKLTLKGKAQTLTVPFSVREEAGATVFAGSLPISRKFFDIGGAGWDGTVEDQVTVQFHLVQPK